MAINQAYLFLIFTLNGVFIGLLFDFFRILRKTFETMNLITYIEDIIFWVLTGISIIFCMYKFSDGNLRLFMFIGLAFGIILYMLTLSKIIINTCVEIITFFKKIFNKIIKMIIIPIKLIYKFLYKIILKPLFKLYAVLSKKFLKLCYLIKNNKKIKKM